MSDHYKNKKLLQSITTRKLSRRHLLGGGASLAAATTAAAGSLRPTTSAAAEVGSIYCGPWKQPTQGDLDSVVRRDHYSFIRRLLNVIEHDIAPETLKGVAKGNKIFGGSILRKDDLSVINVATNSESANPLLHGEITLINHFYSTCQDANLSAQDTIFLSTHEPCPLCLAGIAWGGFDNIFYYYSYEDTRDLFGIPHDLRMLEEVFRCREGMYNPSNMYFNAWSLKALAKDLLEIQSEGIRQQLNRIDQLYEKMSGMYQQMKAAGTGANVPLK